MKKSNFLILALLLIACSFQIQAQEKGTVRASLAGLYADDIREGGVNFSYEHFFTSRLSGAVGWSYFFISGDRNDNQSNVDARYYFLKGPVQLYALGGLGIYRSKIDDRGKSVRRSINGGVGAVIPLKGRFGLNAQFKYTNALGSFIYQGGLTYRIRK